MSCNRLCLCFALSLVVLGPGAAASIAQAQTPLPVVELQLVDTGFMLPTQITFLPGSPQRLLVLEQAGKIVIIDKGKRVADAPYLDISDRVASGGEKGLLGIAFHPDLKNSPKMYLNYTRSVLLLTSSRLETAISEFSISGAGSPIKDSERVLLSIKQPYPNHNGGQLAFGPDGKLYIGTGDGGDRMDPQNNGQNPRTLLGKILRIDVDSKTPYGIPADNPFTNGVRGAPEIWAYGLRNPWRFSFDREGGTLWAGDVGQDLEEEIDIIEKGKNYGWKVMEGNVCHELGFSCRAGVFEVPVAVYGRNLGGCVTGGFVYRGKSIPSLRGWYIYGDYLSGRIWGLRYELGGPASGLGSPASGGGKVLANEVLLKTDYQISTFGEDEDGELYLADYGKGAVYRFVGKQAGSSWQILNFSKPPPTSSLPLDVPD